MVGAAMLFVMEVQPVPPIVVIEDHDFMFYESVEALVANLEPWYPSRVEYLAFDSEGRQVETLGAAADQEAAADRADLDGQRPREQPSRARYRISAHARRGTHASAARHCRRGRYFCRPGTRLDPPASGDRTPRLELAAPVRAEAD